MEEILAQSELPSAEIGTETFKSQSPRLIHGPSKLIKDRGKEGAVAFLLTLLF